jgi:hypothetical protein
MPSPAIPPLGVVSRFWTFRNKGVKKHGGGIEKSPSGLIKENVAFPSVFFPSLGCLARFFYCVFGRFVTKGLSKIGLKKPRKVFRGLQKSSHLVASIISPPSQNTGSTFFVPPPPPPNTRFLARPEKQGAPGGANKAATYSLFFFLFLFLVSRP